MVQANRNKKEIVCIETNESFNCAGEAAEKMHLSRSSIYHNLQCRSKCVKGYTFQFKGGK